MHNLTQIKQLRLTPHFEQNEGIVTNDTLFHGVFYNSHSDRNDAIDVWAYNTDEVFKYHLKVNPIKVINVTKGLVIHTKGFTIIQFEEPVTLLQLTQDILWK